MLVNFILFHTRIRSESNIFEENESEANDVHSQKKYESEENLFIFL